jgi:hypothetical protein
MKCRLGAVLIFLDSYSIDGHEPFFIKPDWAGLFFLTVKVVVGLLWLICACMAIQSPTPVKRVDFFSSEKHNFIEGVATHFLGRGLWLNIVSQRQLD